MTRPYEHLTAEELDISEQRLAGAMCVDLTVHDVLDALEKLPRLRDEIKHRKVTVWVGLLKLASKRAIDYRRHNVSGVRLEHVLKLTGETQTVRDTADTLFERFEKLLFEDA